MAQEVDIPIPGLATTPDAVAAMAPLTLKNVMFDQWGSITKRPGATTTTRADLDAQAITGLIYSAGFSAYFVVIASKKVYKLSSLAGTAALVSSGTPAGTLNPIMTEGRYLGTPCIFVCWGTKLYMYHESGGATWVDVSTTHSAPQTCSSVTYMDGYAIVGLTTNRFQWSAVLDPTTWSALSFATADTDADSIKRVYAWNRKLYVFGDRTTEVWYNDGVNPFSLLDGGTFQFGLVAPYSVVSTQDFIGFFSSENKFILIRNDGYEVISSPIASKLEGFNSTWTVDAVGNYVMIGGTEMLVWSFSTMPRSYWDGGNGTGVTLAYDLKRKVWCDWTTYSNPTHSGLHVMATAYDSTSAQTAVALKTARTLGVFDKTVFLDNSTPIRSEVELPMMNYGTHNRKRSQALKIKGKKLNSATAISMSVYYRNSVDDSYSGPRTLSITGDNEAMLWNNGMFYNRQYYIICETNTPFVLSNVKEVVDVMVTE